MKNLFLILIISVFASSCATVNRCNRKFPPAESVIVKDSVVTRTITEYKDSLIYLTLPSDTFTKIEYAYRINPVNPSLIDIDSIMSENEFSKAFAWVQQSSLGLSLISKDTTLQFRLDSAIRESTHWNELYHLELKKEVKEVKFIPQFYRFCLWYFIATASALLILIIIKLKKYIPFL